jgi:amino acid transporter
MFCRGLRRRCASSSLSAARGSSAAASARPTVATARLSPGLPILFSAVVTFALGAWIEPLGSYSFLGSILGLGITVPYIMMNVGLIIYFRRSYANEFSPIRHGLLPVLGSLLMLLPIYGQLWPIPPWPYNLVPYLILAWTLAGIGYFYYIRNKRTEMLDAMGRVWEPDLS